MATAPHRPRARKVDYPTGDGKPMAETDIHRDNMMDIIRRCKTASPQNRWSTSRVICSCSMKREIAESTSLRTFS